MVDNGLSVVAIEQSSGKVVGGFTAMDHNASMGFCTMCSMIKIGWKTYQLLPRVGEFMAVIDDLNLELTKEVE